jgi:hypothetical protein
MKYIVAVILMVLLILPVVSAIVRIPCIDDFVCVNRLPRSCTDGSTLGLPYCDGVSGNLGQCRLRQADCGAGKICAAAACITDPNPPEPEPVKVSDPVDPLADFEIDALACRTNIECIAKLGASSCITDASKSEPICVMSSSSKVGSCEMLSATCPGKCQDGKCVDIKAAKRFRFEDCNIPSSNLWKQKFQNEDIVEIPGMYLDQAGVSKGFWNVPGYGAVEVTNREVRLFKLQKSDVNGIIQTINDDPTIEKIISVCPQPDAILGHLHKGIKLVPSPPRTLIGAFGSVLIQAKRDVVKLVGALSAGATTDGPTGFRVRQGQEVQRAVVRSLTNGNPIKVATKFTKSFFESITRPEVTVETARFNRDYEETTVGIVLSSVTFGVI